MQIDKTTLHDLGIFTSTDNGSIADNLNMAATLRGQLQLEKNLRTTYSTVEEILEVQSAIQSIAAQLPNWTNKISNGTLMVVEKYFESRVDSIPSNPNTIAAFVYKISNLHDYNLIKYSTKHLFDFLKGNEELAKNISASPMSKKVADVINEIKKLLSHEAVQEVLKYTSVEALSVSERLRFAKFILERYKHNIHALVNQFAKLDAWAGMATAMQKFNLVFPTLVNTALPEFEATGLYHLQLLSPVKYDIAFNKNKNFLFLTGANMAGKSTFIKTLGCAAYLAHTGMGVPAKTLNISLLHGMLTNINVVDNILKGESYFYNEVQRIKSTIIKIQDDKNWLILIDELFKGTNVEDAMKCSTAVIEGLQKKNNALFVLSTHLYEIGKDLTRFPNIEFKYFETSVVNDELKFNYQLRDGISNDRLGYFILKNEGVVDMLDKM